MVFGVMLVLADIVNPVNIAVNDRGVTDAPVSVRRRAAARRVVQ